ncbi:hypothetical protein [Xanthobacter sp.]|uniref:hypothetical protein n=1 Tax=Xanthobacter sp. TaxID=35809 RepID=UPI0025D9D23F|nr:hypothetical protein [Xanthobacter sp.]
MIVTEEMLAPYRLDGGPLRLWPFGGALSRAPSVPMKLFSSSGEFFGPLWWSGSARDNPEQNLQVVLVLAFTELVPVLRPWREWLALKHQAGGMMCEHVSMIATRLEPSPTLKPALDAIARDNYFAEEGRFNKSDILASRPANYVKALGALGLDCEWSRHLLTESVYPIDATQKNLNRIAADPPALDGLFDWTGMTREQSSLNPAILLLTENSD